MSEHTFLGKPMILVDELHGAPKGEIILCDPFIVPSVVLGGPFPAGGLKDGGPIEMRPATAEDFAAINDAIAEDARERAATVICELVAGEPLRAGQIVVLQPDGRTVMLDRGEQGQRFVVMQHANQGNLVRVTDKASLCTDWTPPAEPAEEPKPIKFREFL